MKKNLFRLFMALFVMAIAYVNVKSITLGRDSPVVSLFNLEQNALASENDGNHFRKAVDGDCIYWIREVIGYDAENMPVIEKIGHPGSVGVCRGDEGPCKPWDCAKRTVF